MRTHWRWIILIGTILSILSARVAGAAEPSMSKYELRLDTRADGSGTVVLAVEAEAAGEATLTLPFPFKDCESLSLVEGPAGAVLKAENVNTQARIVVSLPSASPGTLTLRLRCDLKQALSEPTPAGRFVRVSLLNTEPGSIGEVSVQVTFPDGLRGHAIREARPVAGKSEASPRAVLDEIDGRAGVRLETLVLTQGDTAALRVDLTSARPSPGFLVAGLLLGILYLISFRDLVDGAKK